MGRRDGSLGSFHQRRLSRRQALKAVAGLGVGLAGMSSLGVFGCQAKRRDTLTVAMNNLEQAIDPQRLTNVQSEFRHIYEPLVERDATMKLVGRLAESWELVDPRTWKFNLRKGVKFHNGEEFTAESVKFTLERVINPDTKSGQAFLFTLIDKVEVADKNTAIIRTKSPFGALLANLSAYGGMLPPSAATDSKILTERPTGTGPYKFVEFKKGEQWVLEANPDYWGTKAKVPRVIYRSIMEDSTRVAALQAGEIDVMRVVPPDKVDVVTKDSNLVYSKVPSVVTRYLMFNNKKKPLDDIRVRQAFAYGIDRFTIHKSILKGRGSVAKAPLSPPVFGHNPNLEPYPYDPKKAKALLEQAGLGGGFETVNMYFTGNYYPVDDQVAQAIAEQMGAIGVKVKLDAKENQAGLVFIRAHNYDMNQAGWATLTGDPDFGLYLHFRSIPEGNRPYYENPAVDKLLDEAKAETDQSKREKLYWQVQEILWKEEPYVWLWHDDSDLAMRKNVKGVAPRPDQLVIVRDAFFE
jgi:peptide/nickel transport system substrate-binding protein